MHADDAVVDLAPTAEPLAGGPRGVRAALGRAGFVEAADSLGMSVFAGDDSLALVSDALLIPLDRLDEPLKGARGGVEFEGDGLDVLALDARQQPLDVDLEQGATWAAAKAVRKQREKRGQFPAEAGNLLERHPDGPPWRSSVKPKTRRIVEIAAQANPNLPHRQDLTMLSRRKVALSN
jgi:hypothetical protein